MSQDELKRELDLIDVRNPLFITVSEYKEKPRLDLRHFYTDKDTNELKPTKKGINILLGDVPMLVENLIQAYEEYTGLTWEERVP